MPITSVTKDPEHLTMTVVADFAVPVRRLWDAYADPRQLEKFWGPVEYPARFYRHDMAVGGESRYTMTGPDGDTSSGWWEFLEVVEGERFSVLDGFANPDGTKADFAPPMRMDFVFEATDSGSRMTCTTLFASIESLEQMTAMGMEEGMRSAMSQIDAVVADLASFAAGRATELQILNDTQVRISRVIRGTVDQVWRAHHDADLVRRWMTGPDGWEMTDCKIAEQAGESYLYVWAPIGGGEGEFGLEGELLELSAPYRVVTTERMHGTDGPSTHNEMTLTPTADGTLLTYVVTYPDVTVRDEILATGMIDGMEASYARMEQQLASVVP